MIITLSNKFDKDEFSNNLAGFGLCVECHQNQVWNKLKGQVNLGIIPTTVGPYTVQDHKYGPRVLYSSPGPCVLSLKDSVWVLDRA